MKLLVKIFYNILKGLNLIINFFLKRDLLLYLKLLIEKDSYVKKNILGESIIFFVPNELIKWRLDTFFTKEPETLSWIDNFEKKKQNYILGYRSEYWIIFNLCELKTF